MPGRPPWTVTMAFRLIAKRGRMSRAFYGNTKKVKPKPRANLTRLRAIKELLVNFCRQDKIALSQPVDFMRVRLHVHAAPRQCDIWMMPFLLGDRADTVHEIERCLKVREGESLRD